MTVCQMKSLNEILALLNQPVLKKDIMITGLAIDSSKLIGGELFLAITGLLSDNLAYIINAAISAGAAVVFSEYNVSDFNVHVPIICIDNLKSQISFLADHFYCQPSKKLSLIGVTGTNGKTSCCWFIAQLLSLLDQPCAVMGTIGKGVPPTLKACLNTTSDPVSTQQFMAELVNNDVSAIAMEISSHGLDQGRIDQLCFDVGIFTNISRDHLDYHKTMDAYIKAKSLFFSNGYVKKAVINLDDNYSSFMLSSCSNTTEICTFSTKTASADIFASNVYFNKKGLRAHISSPWEQGILKTPQFGRFNLINILAVIGALCIQGYDFKKVLQLIPELIAVPGRMQQLGGDDQPMAIVDYAHTPDALASVLSALKEHGAEKLTCIFGCGGDRDKGKRPLMARAAAEGANKVIITSDNPRNEQPAVIIEDILKGIPVENRDHIIVITDRSKAIQQSIASAQIDDIIVIVGKGHEDYQEINGQRIHFNDYEEATKALALWSIRESSG